MLIASLMASLAGLNEEGTGNPLRWWAIFVRWVSHGSGPSLLVRHALQTACGNALLVNREQGSAGPELVT